MHIKTSPGPDTIFAALSHPVRLEIVAMLSEKELCVCEIARHFQQERSVISRHLMLLEQAGVVESRQQGRMVIYWLRDQRVMDLIDIVIDIVKNRRTER